MAKSKNNQSSKLGVLAIAAGLLLLVYLAIWVTQQNYTAAYDRESSDQVIMEQFKEARQTPSGSLATYIDKLDKESGCENSENTSPMHQLRIEYRDFAKLAYGCGSTDAVMYVTKSSGEWKTISPTNNFVAGLPLCSHVKKHDIPAALYAEGCFEPSSDKNSPVTGRVIAPSV